MLQKKRLLANPAEPSNLGTQTESVSNWAVSWTRRVIAHRNGERLLAISFDEKKDQLVHYGIRRPFRYLIRLP